MIDVDGLEQRAKHVLKVTGGRPQAAVIVGADEVLELVAELNDARSRLAEVAHLHRPFIDTGSRPVDGGKEYAQCLCGWIDEVGSTRCRNQAHQGNVQGAYRERLDAARERERVLVAAIANFFTPGPGVGMPEYHTYPNGARNDDEPAYRTWNTKLDVLRAASQPQCLFRGELLAATPEPPHYSETVEYWREKSEIALGELRHYEEAASKLRRELLKVYAVCSCQARGPRCTSCDRRALLDETAWLAEEKSTGGDL